MQLRRAMSGDATLGLAVVSNGESAQQQSSLNAKRCLEERIVTVRRITTIIAERSEAKLTT
jgi:hypothetical protein